MSSVREYRDFIDIVDHGGFYPPPNRPWDEPGGGGGGWPKWGTYAVAFLLGAIVSNTLLLAPAFAPLAVLATVIAVVTHAARRRWR